VKHESIEHLALGDLVGIINTFHVSLCQDHQAGRVFRLVDNHLVLADREPDRKMGIRICKMADAGTSITTRRIAVRLEPCSSGNLSNLAALPWTS
jgi:hypothetical protein